jgi:hypothetical protein
MRAVPYIIFPARIAIGEHGRVFNPPMVPRSASLVNDVVNISIFMKK